MRMGMGRGRRSNLRKLKGAPRKMGVLLRPPLPPLLHPLQLLLLLPPLLMSPPLMTASLRKEQPPPLPPPPPQPLLQLLPLLLPLPLPLPLRLRLLRLQSLARLLPLCSRRRRVRWC